MGSTILFSSETSYKNKKQLVLAVKCEHNFPAIIEYNAVLWIERITEALGTHWKSKANVVTSFILPNFPLFNFLLRTKKSCFWNMYISLI